MYLLDCIYIQMGARRGKQRKDTPESGEDSDEYRKKRDRNNLVRNSSIFSNSNTIKHLE